MAKVELKKPIVEEISNVISDADSVVLVNYSGLTVAQDTELRRMLREAGITYKVYKNTMMNFAFQGTPCEELCKHLEGTNALAVSKDDATAPARVLAGFAKKNPQLELIAAAGKHSVQRRTAGQTAWKHAVSDCKLRPRNQADRRKRRDCSSRITGLSWSLPEAG